MKNPTQEQFQVVIDNFEKAINKFPKAKVDMGETDINECGTPMCHAGWYGLITNLRDSDILASYSDGYKKMATDLGFANDRELLEWAEFNKQIWGNSEGGYMFSSDFAFGDGCTLVINLQQIIDHWKAVKQRAATP